MWVFGVSPLMAKSGKTVATYPLVAEQLQYVLGLENAIIAVEGYT